MPCQVTFLMESTKSNLSIHSLSQFSSCAVVKGLREMPKEYEQRPHTMVFSSRRYETGQF